MVMANARADGGLELAKDFWINGTDFNPPLFRITFGMQF